MSIFKGNGIYKASSIYKGGEGGGGEETVKIGDIEYPVVKYGNLYWTAQNLDLKWNGLIIGGTTTESPNAAYYNNDEATYGQQGNKNGLLYNHYAVTKLMELNILPDGWRVPTESDFDYFQNNCFNNDGWVLRLNEWGSKGSNIAKFNLKGAGRYTVNNTFADLNTWWSMWSQKRTSVTSCYYMNMVGSTTTLYRSSGWGNIPQSCIRLCKDV